MLPAVRKITLGTILLVSFMNSASGIIIYDTFDPGDSYNSRHLFTVGLFADSVFEQADLFRPTQSGHLSGVSLAFRHEIGANQYEVQITEDDSGEPGSVLESIFLDGIMPSTPGGEVVEIPMSGTVALNQLTDYWLVMRAASTTNRGTAFHSISGIGLHLFKDTIVPTE